jgi:hypothetical protein
MNPAKSMDSDGETVHDGDYISFSYGIPPLVVVAKVIQKGKCLFALTPDHTPKECSLKKLKKRVGDFYKREAPCLVE